jgi:hypothetical protein
MPWLPYGERDRVIINAHNFTPPFIPTDVAGLRSWHDASDASTLYDATSGGSLVAADAAIARWEDKSGNGWHLINATPGQRPLRKLGIQNGLACGLFDGTDDRLRTSSNFSETGNAEFSVFVVSKKLTAVKGTVMGWGQSAASLGASGIYDDNTFVQWGYAGGNGFQISAIGTTSFHLHSYLKSSGAINTTSTFRRDLTSVATTGHQATTPNILSAPLSVGIWADYSLSTYHGYVSEMLIYDSKLSDTNRDLVESYLRQKWGTA